MGSPHQNGSHGPSKHFIKRDTIVPSHILTLKGFLCFLVDGNNL